jgi:hypothetical protein
MNKHIRPHIKIDGQRGRWSVYLVVEEHTFCIAFDRMMFEALQHQKELTTALKKLRKKWRNE